MEAHDVGQVKVTNDYICRGKWRVGLIMIFNLLLLRLGLVLVLLRYRLGIL